MNTALNRTGVLLLTNKSGGAVFQGDVVVVDTANDSAFTTTTTGAYVTTEVGVVLEPNGIPDGSVGTIALTGFVPKINLATSASIGDFVKTHTVAKQGARHNSPKTTGDFAEVLGTGTSPEAILFGTSVVGAGGSALEVKEVDGDPDVSNVSLIIVSNGTLTDNTGGSVTILTGGGSGGGASFLTQQVFS